ncbi:MAG: class IV adenylate cyclase [Candidatus Peribacteraceae bacterium]|nr:class IV adenylate cyclase [Candidatus Peribacteraceae bacterium]
MPKEIEIKFSVEDENEMLRMLEHIGAEQISSGLEHNIVFDNDELRKNNFLLRLRQYAGKNILTFKHTIEQKEFKEANETETHVSDFNAMKEIILSLGYEVFWIYEKERTKFRIRDTIVSIDKLPFATFMEIEGSENGIRDTISKLGLDMTNGITETYLELYQKHCKEKDIEMDNLIFWKRSK